MSSTILAYLPFFFSIAQGCKNLCQICADSETILLPGLMKLQQNAKEKLAVVQDQELNRQLEFIRFYNYLLMPELQGKGLPGYWETLQKGNIVLFPEDHETWNTMNSTEFQERALVAMLKKHMELALQYPVGSKEYKLLANTHEVMRGQRPSVNEKACQKSGYTQKLDLENEGIASLQKLYESSMNAQDRLCQIILDEKPWPVDNKNAMYELVGKKLGHVVVYNFIDSMLQMNKDLGPEVTRYLYEGITVALRGDYADLVTETEPFKKMLSKGPEHLAKVLTNPEMPQKFSFLTMQALNRDPKTRNTVYAMGMMEHEGPLPVNEDGTVSELAPPPVQVQMFR